MNRTRKNNSHRDTEAQSTMYKRLTQRDIIQAGDEYRTNWGWWETIKPEYVGKRKGAVFGWYVKMRRKDLAHTEKGEGDEP